MNKLILLMCVISMSCTSIKKIFKTKEKTKTDVTIKQNIKIDCLSFELSP